jgi:hypothetical protein
MFDESDNPFKKGDRVIVSDTESQFHKLKGTVKYTFDISTEVLLDNKTTVVICYKRLQKLKKVKKKKK